MQEACTRSLSEIGKIAFVMDLPAVLEAILDVVEPTTRGNQRRPTKKVRADLGSMSSFGEILNEA